MKVKLVLKFNLGGQIISLLALLLLRVVSLWSCGKPSATPYRSVRRYLLLQICIVRPYGH